MKTSLTLRIARRFVAHEGCTGGCLAGTACTGGSGCTGGCAGEEKCLGGCGGPVAVAPPGWEGPVKEMKKDKDIDNPWALAWHMKNKGDTVHKKEAELVDRVASKFAMEHPSEEARKTYLHEHPGAVPSNHTVK